MSPSNFVYDVTNTMTIATVTKLINMQISCHNYQCYYTVHTKQVKLLSCVTYQSFMVIASVTIWHVTLDNIFTMSQ